MLFFADLDRFTPRALVTCAWSLAALQQLQHPLFGMLWTNLCGRAMPAFSKPSLLQLHQVSMFCKTSCLSVGIHDVQPVAVWRTAWISTQHCTHRNTFIAVCSLSATKGCMGKLLIFTPISVLCLICFLVPPLDVCRFR